MIDIALASDANYACGLLVTAVSMARSASPDAVLRFNVMDGGIPDDMWDDFTFQVRKFHSASEFRRFRVDDTCFNAYPSWSGTGRMTYARFLLPQLLSDIDYVIYCDVDFLWLADVAELWKVRRPNVLAFSTREGKDPTRRIEEPWFAKQGLPYSFDTYICAGLILFNLALCRRLRVIDQARAFLDSHSDVQVADQSALNAVLGGSTLAEGVTNVSFLPARWQVFSGDVTNEFLAEGCVIHYAGAAPWRFAHRRVLLSDALLIWHRLNAEIRHCSVWQSLRSFLPLGRIVLRRLLFLLFATPGIRGLCWLMLTLMGHRACVKTFAAECHRLRKFNFDKGEV